MLIFYKAYTEGASSNLQIPDQEPNLIVIHRIQLILFGDIRVCGKGGMNTAKPSNLVVKPQNSCYKIVAFINNAFERVLGDTVSHSMCENFEVSVEVCQGLRSPNSTKKITIVTPCCFRLGFIFSNSFIKQLSLYKSYRI